MFNSAPHSPLSYQIRPFPFTLEENRWKWIKKGTSLAIQLKGKLTFFFFLEKTHVKETIDHNTQYHIKKKDAYRMRSSRLVRASYCQY
jgi:hypothetical protein